MREEVSSIFSVTTTRYSLSEYKTVIDEYINYVHAYIVTEKFYENCYVFFTVEKRIFGVYSMNTGILYPTFTERKMLRKSELHMALGHSLSEAPRE